MELEYPDRDAALLAYAEALEISYEDAIDALLSEDQLESALARPRNASAYENADLIRQAATLFWGITTDHPFRDGNKRLATVLLRAFLDVNGHELTLSETNESTSRWGSRSITGASIASRRSCAQRCGRPLERDDVEVWSSRARRTCDRCSAADHAMADREAPRHPC